METTKYSFWSPDLPGLYSIVATTAAMQQSVEDGLDEVLKHRSGTTAQRDAWTTRPAGALWSNTSNNELQMYASGTWKTVFRPRTTFTPVWSNLLTGSGATSTGWYQISGSLCQGMIRLTLGTGFAFNLDGVLVAPPVPPANAVSATPVGTATYEDAGVGWWQGNLIFNGTGQIRLMHTKNDGGGHYGQVTATGPVNGWSVGDSLLLQFSYEVA